MIIGPPPKFHGARDILGVLSTMGLRLSLEKTLITHIDEGLVFLRSEEHTSELQSL